MAHEPPALSHNIRRSHEVQQDGSAKSRRSGFRIVRRVDGGRVQRRQPRQQQRQQRQRSVTDHVPRRRTTTRRSQDGKALIAAFQTANPGITVKMDSRPGGTDGDNLDQDPARPPATWPTCSSTTRLAAAGDQARATNLAPLDDQPWAGQLDEQLRDLRSPSTASSTACPSGTASAAACSTTPVYKKLDLQVPKTWDEFMANSAEDQGGRASPRSSRPTARPGPRSCSCWATTTTSRPQVPDFADEVHREPGQVRHHPGGLAGFQHMQQVKDAGYFNKDFASAKLNDGLKAVATGQGGAVPAARRLRRRTIDARSPGQDQRRRLLRPPGHDAATNGMTVWPGTSALYIPKTDGGRQARRGQEVRRLRRQPRRAATRTLKAVAADRARSCQGVQAARRRVRRSPRTPRRTSTPASATPALEFLSPIKGPTLEQITVQVGTGRSAPQKARRALRRGRQEAGAAARPARLVLTDRRSGPPPACRAGGTPTKEDPDGEHN